MWKHELEMWQNGTFLEHGVITIIDHSTHGNHIADAAIVVIYGKVDGQIHQGLLHAKVAFDDLDLAFDLTTTCGSRIFHLQSQFLRILVT